MTLVDICKSFRRQIFIGSTVILVFLPIVENFFFATSDIFIKENWILEVVLKDPCVCVSHEEPALKY